jgi:catecholate siderophore receptor
VFGGLTLLDAKTVKTPVAAQQGLGFPNISKTSFNLMTRYQATSRFYVGGQANYNSKKFGGTNVALATFVPGYWRFDAFAGYRVTNRIEVSVNVLNLTNKRYYDALYRSATPFVYQAPGRSAMLRLRLDL